jgi:two-component system, sensor histidine kinase
MKKISLINWLRNVSIAKKLYFTVGTMALLIAIELMTLLFAIKTLSSVRTLVSAEGLWSKAQKDATLNLQKYGISRDEKDYQAYENFLKINLGDRKTRLELLKKDPDLNIAREGFREGKIHPDDIDGAINLFRRFHNISYISQAIAIWSKGDTMISQLQAIGDDLHARIKADNPSPEKINVLLKQIDDLNDRLTILENNFSYTLGAGSRWLTGLILKLLFCVALTVEISGLSLTIFVSRGIGKGLNEIIRSAKKITTGDFSSRAKSYSKDEIGVLANSFNDMTDKLERNINALKESETALQKSKEMAEHAVVIKDHFLANMSHELRTPMNAIIGFTDLLNNSPLNEEQQQYVQAIKTSGLSMKSIINDILGYSKLESGMIVLEKMPLSIRKILGSIHVLLYEKALKKNIDFKYQVDEKIPETLIGDPMKLTQILTNLIDNALKFTEEGSVEINVLPNSETEDLVTLEFQIKDTGIGIPLDKQAIIFERFTQAGEDTARRFGGTGLGLSIVKSLIDLQHGAIWVQSEVDKGSVFMFTLTFQKQKTQNPSPKDAPKQSFPKEKENKLQILYVEDNPMNQKLMLHFSRNFGFVTEIAINGHAAIKKIKAKQYDLILMDIQMPEMDGYETTHIIRNELKSNIPIIAVTAYTLNGEKEKCLHVGMNDFISKPFDINELNDKIMSFF